MGRVKGGLATPEFGIFDVFSSSIFPLLGLEASHSCLLLFTKYLSTRVKQEAINGVIDSIFFLHLNAKKITETKS